MDRPVQALLIVAAVVVLAMLGLAVLADRPRAVRRAPPLLPAEAEELAAHAAAAQTRAGRAAAIAYVAREELIAAERARAEAWAAQEATERAYDCAWQAALAGRQVAAGNGNGAGERERADRERADRERVVSRAALSAYQRGDISVREFREVWRRAGEWDPAQEERERIADRYRLRQAAARRVHDRSAAAVRRAYQAARLAEVAAQALIDEAVESAVEAHEALLTTRRYAGRRPPRPRKPSS